jgi:hypothetical protein
MTPFLPIVRTPRADLAGSCLPLAQRNLARLRRRIDVFVTARDVVRLKAGS